jgi:hypothetical protein
MKTRKKLDLANALSGGKGPINLKVDLTSGRQRHSTGRSDRAATFGMPALTNLRHREIGAAFPGETLIR